MAKHDSKTRREESMDFGIDVNLAGLIVCGFATAFTVWALSRGVRMVFEIAGSRNGYIKPN